MKNKSSDRKILSKTRLPFYVWVVALSTVIACGSGKAVMGYQVASLGWLLPLGAAPLVLMKTRGPIRFPVTIWLPWIGVVVGYLIFAEAPNALQRSVMMLCPLVVGMAVSRLPVGGNELEKFTRLCRHMAIALYVIVFLKTGMLLTGTLPRAANLAAEIMTGALFCTLFATSYMYGKKKDLLWWAALAVIPVIAVTRAGMIASGLTLPLTFAPMKVFKRGLFIVLILAAGYGLFHTERVQQKMFYSGSGTLQDISLENPDFSTSGRSNIWEHMRYEIDAMPWFGHGANASEPFVSMLTGGLTHPHNDWLRLLFDYGYFGAVVFGLCLVMQLVHAVQMGRKSAGDTRLLFYAGASSLLIFALFMLSDNIILYAAFFGNMQFTVFGMAYAAYGTEQKKNRQDNASKRPLYKRIRW